MALGFVMEAGTEEPAEGARVSVGWTDYSVKGKKINRTKQERSGSAGPDGSYKVCGISDDLVTGSDCVRYFVDGHIWLDPEESPNAYISGRELGAVEVYSGLTAPPQFSAMSPEGRPCTAVVIWTRWKLRM